MRALKMLAIASCIAVLLAALGSTVRATESDKLTIFTFSKPVELPGNRVLPAGTYAFKLLDSAASRNVVQVFNKDRTMLYATVLTIPDYRPQPHDKTIITFAETAEGGPYAIKEWFYPGDQYGQEFVYPKPRATELAKAANQSVPAMPSEQASNISEPSTSSNDPSVMAMKNSQLKAENANGKETEVEDSFGSNPANGQERKRQTGK